MKKNFYLIFLLVVLIGISIGYAAMNKALNITGNSKVEKNTWNVYLDNPLVTNGSVNEDLPVVDSVTKTTVDFSATLNLPGDFYEFTVDVKNEGTIDAMIESIENTLNLTDEQKKYINYTISYQCDKELKSKQVIKSDDFVRIKIRVEYRTDIIETDLPDTYQNLDLSFTLNYVQADNTGEIINNNGIICANGDINQIGTVVTIGAEKFYTIGLDEDNVKLLSMYNLYVGNKVIGENVNGNLLMSEITNPSGIQNFNSRGALFKKEGESFVFQFPWIGTTAFASEKIRGTDYSDYNGSIVEEYVNNYKTIIEEDYGIDVVEARLITKDELTDSSTFSCTTENNSCLNSPYPWIYACTYWIETAFDANNVWRVFTNGVFDYYGYYDDNASGVRPVLVISKSLF